jgi:hypothetical protein
MMKESVIIKNLEDILLYIKYAFKWSFEVYHKTIYKTFAFIFEINFINTTIISIFNEILVFA